MRVALAVPTGDEVKSDFWVAFSYLLVEAVSDGIETVLLNCRTSLITNSRYQLVKAALDRGCDRVFFIDSDLAFPRDSLRRLLAWDRSIVGATYVRRREPREILGYGLEDLPPGSSGLQRVARLPAGLLLIEASVFDRVPKPWFIDEWQPETEDFKSEDYAFCDSARACGYDVWCDLDLSREIGHVGQMVFTWSSSELKTKE